MIGRSCVELLKKKLKERWEVHSQTCSLQGLKGPVQSGKTVDVQLSMIMSKVWSGWPKRKRRGDLVTLAGSF